MVRVPDPPGSGSPTLPTLEVFLRIKFSKILPFLFSGWDIPRKNEDP
jgi:hypothetical protein